VINFACHFLFLLRSFFAKRAVYRDFPCPGLPSIISNVAIYLSVTPIIKPKKIAKRIFVVVLKCSIF